MSEPSPSTSKGKGTSVRDPKTGRFMAQQAADTISRIKDKLPPLGEEEEEDEDNVQNVLSELRKQFEDLDGAFGTLEERIEQLERNNEQLGWSATSGVS